ncbi:hypothetical protein BU26DRAFT_502675 [Trematosphaeria pertusa]|uniref:Uncharacterized protein n=1 Tax=Trematosphaeria pertusa TaxID=390896 RepID=A0A6A6INV1_9PLEO|nr:uncharacterized protein BU26DRAFT_502675 [Trematosphaeria pertusa]KAF2252151.1 hypothetical protein BU26DRAFT_502675 [Trematosphaeria pertusa]
MSSNTSMDAILTAINNLKQEVTGLRSSLNSAEDRIARLEAATFTPFGPLSPSENAPEVVQHTSNQGDDAGKQSSLEKTGILESALTTSPPRSNQEAPDKTAQVENTCPPKALCDIQQHLKPVNDSLAAITKQLSRIELAINHSTSTSHSPPSSSPGSIKTHDAQTTDPTPSKKENEPHSLAKEQSSSLDKFGTFRRNLEISGYKKIAENARPVFGLPSTPSRRVSSLNFDVAASPFGSYSDERSPFSLLAKPAGASKAGTLSAEPSTPASCFRGLGSDPRTGFGTPGATGRRN